jgi:hypothetical protein
MPPPRVAPIIPTQLQVPVSAWSEYSTRLELGSLQMLTDLKASLIYWSEDVSEMHTGSNGKLSRILIDLHRVQFG